MKFSKLYWDFRIFKMIGSVLQLSVPKIPIQIIIIIFQSELIPVNPDENLSKKSIFSSMKKVLAKWILIELSVGVILLILFILNVI
jgi:hypothetical protein